MDEPSIRSQGLVKRYGSFTALDRLDLDVSGAKCVGFLGPNGAGKTTTLKLLTGMTFPTEGRAFLNGVPIASQRRQALADCGVLIETPEIYPSLSPVEALEMVAELRGIDPSVRKARIEEVLAEVRMTDWADRQVGMFSKGMKQRINLASALLHDPRLLLLDEPTSGLDPRGMAEVRDIIRGLKKGRRLVFMSSHLLNEVSDVCDEVALLDHGRLLFYDSLANVTRRFGRDATDVDIGLAQPLTEETLRRKLANLPGVEAFDLLDPLRVRLHVTGGPASVERLFSAVGQLGIGVVRFQESASALEEVYMNQIARGD